MTRALRGLKLLMIVVIAAGALRAQTFELGAQLSSDDIPDLDTTGVIGGDPGTQVDFTATMILTSSGVPGDEGPKGWSMGVKNEGVEIIDVTTVGTDAEALFSLPFEVTEVIDPARNGGTQGMVSAVVLSLTQNVTLPPNSTSTIAIANYQATIGESQSTGSVGYVDGLRGSGEPVENVITYLGQSEIPTLGERTLTIGSGGPPAGDTFVRGDPNDDGNVNIADPIWIVNELARGGPATACPDAADANDDGMVDLSDVVYLINYRFLAGPVPSAPFPNCGSDPSGGDDLDCPEGSTTSCP